MPRSERNSQRVSLADELSKSISTGDHEKLENLITKYKEQFENLKSEGGVFSIIEKAIRSHDPVPCLKVLRSYTAEENWKNENGRNALHVAADPERTEGIRFINTSPEDASTGDTSTEEPTGDKTIQYLRSFLNCDDGDHQNRIPLHYAASAGNLGAVKELSKAPANINLEDCHGRPPLFSAILKKKVKVVKFLLDQKASVDLCDKEGNNIFHHVCWKGLSEILKILLPQEIPIEETDKIKRLINSKNCNNLTPLHLAVWFEPRDDNFSFSEEFYPGCATYVGYTKEYLDWIQRKAEAMTHLLLEHGADVDCVDNKSRTPLFYAVSLNRQKIVRILLEWGAKVNHTDSENITPLLWATSIGHTSVCVPLLEHGANVLARGSDGRTTLLNAVEKGKTDMVELLVKAKNGMKLLDKCDSDGNTPLHLAAGKGHLEIVKYLILKRPCVPVKNKEGKTALHLAVSNGHDTIVHALLGCWDPQYPASGENGSLLLRLAAEAGFKSILRSLLFYYRCIKDLQVSGGWTPLCFAADRNQIDCVKLLLEYDARPNAGKVTPIFLACRKGHVDIVNELLEHGADPSIQVWKKHREYAGWNALDVAVEERHEACVRAILRSRWWEAALRNETYELDNEINTPLRRMIRYMPNLAELALSQCITRSELPRHMEEYTEKFNFEFVDNWMEPLTNQPRMAEEPAEPSSQEAAHLLERRQGENEDTTRVDTRRTRHSNAFSRLFGSCRIAGRKRVHPVEDMVAHGRKNLLSHPLVLALLAEKWMRTRRVYYAHCVVYALFLTLFTAFMLLTRPPYTLYPEENLSNTEICKRLENNDLIAYNTHIAVPKYGVMLLAFANLIIEIIQACLLKRLYRKLDNLVDLGVYLCALLVTIDFNFCMMSTGLRQAWQWEAGTVGLWLAWFNVMLLIPKITPFGMYVIMFYEVLKTYAKLLSLFLPLLVAFSLSFHLLLMNQIPFTVLRTGLKTLGMVTGELDINEIMFQNATEPDFIHGVYHEWLTYCLFVLFIILMPIVMMNLLVGLAIGDIKGVQRMAFLKRLEMEWGMSFYMERLLNRFHRSWTTPKLYEYKPNVPGTFRSLYHKQLEAAEISDVPIEDEDRLHMSTKLEEMKEEMKEHISRTLRELLPHVVENAERRTNRGSHS